MLEIVRGDNALPDPIPSGGFVSGTRIRTPLGEVPVETLKAGDLVVTMDRARRLVRRVAQGSLDPDVAAPVRVARGAFGNGLPDRDLLLSPDHGVLVTCVDELLTPIGGFINGATVATAHRDPATYWHVVLDEPDLIFAEGLACGSSDAVKEPCRPICDEPVIVHALRTRLHQTALDLGWTIAMVDADVHLEIDGATHRPDVRGDVARFVMPEAPREVWIVSRSFVPTDVDTSPDTRRLGVQIMSLSVDDGLDVCRAIDIDDPRLSVGFLDAEPAPAGRFRWTNGRAMVPKALWEGCQGRFFLKLKFSAQLLAAWQAPAAPVAPDEATLAGDMA